MFKFKNNLLPIFTVGTFAVAALTFSGASQRKGETNTVGVTNSVLNPISVQALAFAETESVRDLPDATAEEMASFEPHEINEENVIAYKRANPAASSARWPAVDSALVGPQALVAQNLPGAPLVTFDGMAAADGDVTLGGRVAPSDQNMAVGPRDIVQTTNVGFRIWDKSGNPRTNPKLISKLFARLGGVCASTERGDPIVLHDRMADRFIISQFNFANSNAAPFYECIAVSKTSDPTGPYYAYAFQTPVETQSGAGQNFPDYPHIGTWPDGYYMTVNQFDRSLPSGAQFNGTGCYAFDRSKMIVGDPSATYIYFNLNLATRNEGIASMQPSDMDGFTLPPAGSPNVFIYEISDELENAPYKIDALRLFNFHADFATPANSTFTERTESPLPVAAYDARSPQYVTGSRAEAEQPSPAATAAGTPPATQGDSLNVINYHVMYRLQYRRLGNNENLTLSSTVNVSGVTPVTDITYQSGIRYYQLRKTTAATTYAIYDQATFAPDTVDPVAGNNRFLPSAAIDNQGNLGVSYSLSSRSIYPSIYYAGRDFNAAGIPTAGLAGEQTLYAGTASQIASGNRWGDYQSLQVDPTDDCTFWTTNQYYNDPTVAFGSGSFNWRTRIGSFKFPTCTAPPQGTLTGTITSCETGAPISGAIVTLNNGFSGATGPDGRYTIQLPASASVATGTAYTATVISPARKCTQSATYNVTIFNNQATTLDACLNGVALVQLDPTDPNAVVVSGPNGSVIYPNNCQTLNVKLQNNGCAVAKNMTATLSSTTPGVRITNATVPYPSTPIDGSSFNSVPFQFSTDSSVPCGTVLNFTITANYNGGPTSSTFSVATSCGTAPSQTVNNSTDTTKQTTNGRLGRANPPSSCSAAKACPGALGSGPRAYNFNTFTNGPGPSCVTVNPTSPSGASQLVAAAYLGAFDPTNLCANYLADQGASLQPFSFNVPANATFTVVVFESANATGGTAYSLQVSGLSAAPPAGTGACAAAITTQAVPTTATVGASVADTATLTGTSPTGSITFRLYGATDTTCGGTPIFNSVVPVNGNGTYSSASFPINQPGTYRWIASYSGDANNPGATGVCNDPNESVTVSAAPTPTPTPTPVQKATPTLTTQASANVTLGGSISDTATLGGGNTPTGNITFRCYGPNDASCGGTVVFTSTVAVNGAGKYQSAPFTPTAPGTYRWVAAYSGDSLNNGVTTACNDPNESVAVSPTPTPTPTATPTATPTPTPTATPTPAAVAQNISTRAVVGPADASTIGGFIVTNGSKRVLIRGLGPTLSQQGASGVLADPVLSLRASDGSALANNDNWRDTQEAEIKATGIPPTNDLESAIVATLPAGNYTAVLTGKVSTSGIGLVEIYDVDAAGSTSKLANLSTRGQALTGNQVMIGGFILGKNGGTESVIIRGIGPSLAQKGVAAPLADPTLELRDKDGTLLRSNDDWQDDPAQAAAINGAGLAPSNPKESAIQATLPPGNYTAVLAGRNNGTGIGLIELFFQ